MYRGPADFQPMIRQIKDKDKEDEASTTSGKGDEVEPEDHVIARGRIPRVFSIPKPPVLRRSPVGMRPSLRQRIP